jgi:hypothetical protein
MPPKNKNQAPKAPFKKRATTAALVGASIGLAAVLASHNSGEGSGSTGETSSSSHGVSPEHKGDLSCPEPKPVVTVNVTESQIKIFNTKDEIAKIHGMGRAHEVKDVKRVEFSYDHDAIKNVQEGWDFRDAVHDYLGVPVVDVRQPAGATAVGQIVILKCE